MEQPSTTMTPEQGLRIIENMLSRSRQKMQENGLIYRFWGYLVMFSALIHYVGLELLNNETYALVWAVLMPLGGLASWYLGRKQNAVQTIRTWADEALQYVLVSFLVSMAFSLFFGFSFGGWNVAYGFLMLAYGSWLYISGGLMQFKALRVGGIINWMCGALCFYLEGPQCLLILALAVLAGYIIPGHLIQQQYRKEHGQA